jgi:hypothetical protein
MKTTDTSIKANPQEPVKLTCQFCHHSGSDVHRSTSYIGGQGNVTFIECSDIMACNQRMVANKVKANREAKQ